MRKVVVADLEPLRDLHVHVIGPSSVVVHFHGGRVRQMCAEVQLRYQVLPGL